MVHHSLLLRFTSAFCTVAVMAVAGSGGVAPRHAHASVFRLASTGFLFSTSLSGTTADGEHDIQLHVTKNAGGAQSVELDVSIVLTGTLPSDSPIAALGDERRPSSAYVFTLPAADLVIGAAGATLDTHHDLGAYGHVTAHWHFTAPIARVSATPPCGGATLTGQRTSASASATLALTFPCDGTIHGVLQGTEQPISIGQDVTPTLYQPSSGMHFDAKTRYLTISIDTSDATHSSTITIERLGDNAAVLIFSVATFTPAGAALTSAYHSVSDVMPAGSLTVDLQSTRVATLHYRGLLGYADLTIRAQSLAVTNHGIPGATPGISASCLSFTNIGHPAPYTTSFSGKAGGWIALAACTPIAATVIRAPAGATVISAQPMPGAFVVRQMSPADGARGVPVASVVSATFSAPLLGTLSDCFCSLAPPQRAYQVSVGMEPTKGVLSSYPDLGPTSYDPATRTATWRPRTALAPHTTYQIQLTASDSRGGSLTWITHFTTSG